MFVLIRGYQPKALWPDHAPGTMFSTSNACRTKHSNPTHLVTLGIAGICRLNRVSFFVSVHLQLVVRNEV